MEPGSRPAACPRCGTTADVHTAQELFGMLSDMRANAMRQAAQHDIPAPSPGTDWIDDPRYSVDSDDPAQGIADTLVGLAGHLISRTIGKRARRVYQERIAPALDARAQQVQQDWDRSLADQSVIAGRYPDLRGCLRDRVLFLAGGTAAMPMSEIRLPVTLEQADSIVARLQGGTP